MIQKRQYVLPTWFILPMFLISGLFSDVFAQENPVTVTFVVNTSTVADTLTENHVVQMRGAINGSEDGEINWGSTSKQATNVGGDYWEIDLELNPGDEVAYKFWTGTNTESGLGYDGGWETGDNNIFTVPADASEDIRTDVIYFARPEIGRQAPFTYGAGEEGEVALHFRVNVGNLIATNVLDTTNANHVVGVRGQINPETGEVAHKFVIDKGDEINWESTPDRFVNIPAADSTLHWVFFSDTPPPTGEIVTADVEFTVNVGLLEGLGYFNRAIGDFVAVPGGFNGWDTSTSMTYDEIEDVWTSTQEITGEVGTSVAYKYFINWDDSRFDPESPNYIPNLTEGNGWEEPGTTGGADRTYELTAETVQSATGDFGTSIAYFNSIPQEALITQDGTGTATYPVTFKLDMTAALDYQAQPFNPAEDSVYLMLETPILGLTQGIPIGDGAPIFNPGNEQVLERVRFEPTGTGNMYELTLDLDLPAENHFGFTIAYVGENGNRVQNGGGFNAGRRYYRYAQPELVIDGTSTWPAGGYELDMIEWKEEDLDFPTPPDYGLGGGTLAYDFFNDAKPTVLDWGATMPLQLEPVKDENTQNVFYSGTLYIQTGSTEPPADPDVRPVLFSVDMEDVSSFNPETDEVYVRGAFNDWGTTQLFSDEEDLYYETIVEVEGATGSNIAYKFYYADPSDIDNGVWENNLPSDRSFELFPAGIIQLLPDTDFDVELYDYTYLQIIHNSADPAVESVDIYVDGDMAIDEFAFREATVFLPAPTDVELQLTITPAGADPAAGVTVPVTLEEDQKYYAIASGVLNPDNFAASPTSSDIGFRLDLVAGTQLSAASDSLSFKIMHGSTDAPAVDLFVQGLPDPIVSGATFSAITDYITVPAPEVYTIDLYASGVNIYLASYEVDATNLAGGTAFITASGFINPAANQDGEGFAVLAVFADGSTTLLESVTSSIEDGNEFPTAYTLSQNYPNPFNPSTTIQYSLPEVAEVMLEVYNMLGQKVASLVEARQSAGTYTIEFDGSGLASGTYMYRMQAGDFVQTRKFALIK
ncbi:MAG: DUF4397 domain-containing protein [Bacteroidetes bacterium]|nr:DUF4397 domain-containing protein [Bacteroidota bacterium]